ncbi:hypothetical protein CON78_15805 [Bacillus toyonensis]|uniref:hypothetical protein n=1 Tax=Bacillus cereus group TaxID=86661 RepID=UPI000BEE3CBC|nr:MULTISPECIES: hypothetical protein [Bacillus cereus group]PED99593.1 hypothetical protein CON78_15805 [Bacillus toyonensis]PHD95395.1 hypothetical protein COF55_00145 [Bacillus toyonensis]
MTVNRKIIPDGFKYYITCEDKKGQKYYRYNHAPSWEYPDGRKEDTTTFPEISNKFKEEVLNARESNAEVSMQTGPQGEQVKVAPHDIELSTVAIENYSPNRIFGYRE